MKAQLSLLADYADEEFDGESYNGHSLMDTLSSLDAPDAASESTFEGYSAWSIALHVAYCKWVVASELLDEAGRDKLGPYPYPVGEGGYAAPSVTSDEAWASFKDYLVRVHRLATRAIREVGEEKSRGQMQAWKIPMLKVLVWLCGHDSYHTAQIRNMGLEALKLKRLY